jgi:hypothetical protein
MKRLVRRVFRRIRWQRPGGQVIPPAGRCDSCHELSAKCPATVLRAESYRGTATEMGGRA